jgi:antitoxin VapB
MSARPSSKAVAKSKEPALVKTAKLFTNGGSQAVRLPKEFAFEGTEVVVTKEGARVILSAISAGPKFETMGQLVDYMAMRFPESSTLERPVQPSMPPSVSFED